MSVGCIHSLEWNTGLDWNTGMTSDLSYLRLSSTSTAYMSSLGQSGHSSYVAVLLVAHLRGLLKLLSQCKLTQHITPPNKLHSRIR